MPRDAPPCRIDIMASAETPEISSSRARLCNFAATEKHLNRTTSAHALIDPCLLLELVAQLAPREHVRLVFERTERAWRFDVEAHRFGSTDAADAGLAATLKIIAPAAEFKQVNLAGPENRHVVALTPRASVIFGEDSTRIWFPSLPHATPDLSLALLAARALGIDRVAFTIEPFILSNEQRAALEASRFRSQAKPALTGQERACGGVTTLWLEAGHGVNFQIELGSAAPITRDALNAISAALFGRADRDPFDAPDLDLRLAVPTGALPLFRFWPTPDDLSLFSQAVCEIEDGPGSIAIGMDAVGDQLRLSSADRMMHTAVWGGSGAGKTTFMTNCILEDICKGEGVMLIDVHGDMADRVMELLPAHRRTDLICFDASQETLSWRLDLMTTPGVSPLLERSRLTNMFIGFFRQMYAAIPESMGPAFEQYFTQAFKLLLSARNEEDRSLLRFDDVLLDRAFRSKLLRECDDPKVRQFWQDCAEHVTGDNQLDNIAPYITNKMTQFTQNPLTAAAIGGAKPRLDLRRAMDARKIVIIRLPKGLIGEYDARFLGALFLMATTEAALSRANISISDRVPFRVYIDEFADLATASAARLLAECRKYGLSLMLANQSLSQLNGDKFNEASVGQAMLSNCGSFILFRLSLTDALALSATVEGVSARELTQLGVGDIVARRLVRGVPHSAERLRGLPPPSDADRIAV